MISNCSLKIGNRKMFCLTVVARSIVEDVPELGDNIDCASILVLFKLNASFIFKFAILVDPLL